MDQRRDGGNVRDHRFAADFGADVEHGLEGQLSKEVAGNFGASDGSKMVAEDGGVHASSRIGVNRVLDELAQSVAALAEDESVGALIFRPPEFPSTGILVATCGWPVKLNQVSSLALGTPRIFGGPSRSSEA